MRTTLGIGWTWPTHRDTYRQGFDPAALRAWATVEVEVEHVGSDQELAEAVFIARSVRALLQQGVGVDQLFDWDD